MQPELERPLLVPPSGPQVNGRAPRPSPAPAEPLEARTVLAVVRRRQWFMLAIVIASVAAALVVSALQEERYRATTEVLLGRPEGAGELTEVARANELRIIQSRTLADAVAEQIGERSKIAVDVVEVSDAVRLAATHPEPEMAVTIADTYAEVYLEERRTRSLQQLGERQTELRNRYDVVTGQLDELTAPVQQLDAQIATAVDPDVREQLEDQRVRLANDIAAQRQALVGQQATYAQQLNELLLAQSTVHSSSGEILSPAILPTEPYQPAPLRNALAAGLLGVTVAIGAAFLRERFDDSLDSATEARELLGLPVFGTVPDMGSRPARLDPIGERDHDGGLAESFRMIRTSVNFIAVEQPISSIAVTSADPGEGKTATALNLASTLAWEGRRIALVEVDLRQPSLGQRLGASGQQGLAGVLLQELALEDAMWRPQGLDVSVLLAGGEPPNAAELLSSSRMRRIQERLEKDHDLVIYDLPPLLPVSDAVVMSRHVDAVLLVVSAKLSRRSRVAQATELLRDNGANVIGVVFNRSRRGPSYYGA